MTTATVHYPIHGIDSRGRGAMLTSGDYEIVRLVGSDPGLVYVYDPEADRQVCIGKNDPGVTMNWETT